MVVADAVAAAPRPAVPRPGQRRGGAIGYGIGVFAVWLVRYMRSKDASPPTRPGWAWLALVVVGVIGQILMII